MNEEEKAIQQTQNELRELGLEPTVVEEEKTETQEETKSDDQQVSKSDEKEEVESKDDDVKDESDEDEPSKFDFKHYKRELKEKLQADFDQKFEKLKEEMSKAIPNKETTNDLEADIKSLAEELNFDEEKTRKIVQTARKGLELSAEDKALLAEYKESKPLLEKMKQAEFEREQEHIFNTEFEQVLPELQRQFPNASKEQIALVKKELDELAHSEKYHETELDYIAYKERDRLSKILFSPKMKTFESTDPSITTEAEEFTPKSHDQIVDMTPAQFAAYEKRMEKMMNDSPKEKLRITTRNDRGHIVERYE